MLFENNDNRQIHGKSITVKLAIYLEKKPLWCSGYATRLINQGVVGSIPGFSEVPSPYDLSCWWDVKLKHNIP